MGVDKRIVQFSLRGGNCCALLMYYFCLIVYVKWFICDNNQSRERRIRERKEQKNSSMCLFISAMRESKNTCAILTVVDFNMVAQVLADRVKCRHKQQMDSHNNEDAINSMWASKVQKAQISSGTT